MTQSNDELRAIIFEEVSKVVEGLQKHLDEQILEIQVDVDEALEKLDALAVDVREAKQQAARVTRAWMRAERRELRLRKRVEDIELREKKSGKP